MRFTRPSVSTVYNAANPVLGIVREATDGLPIVGQVFAVVQQIAALAQKIDKQRESLRELVKKSRELATAITRAVGDRTPPAHLKPTLDRTLSTLREVEDFMTSHMKKSRFKRWWSHLTFVPDEIERLKLALTDVLEELQMVTAVDTNFRIVSAEAKIDDNTLWEGPICRLHDGLMDKGQLLFTQPLLENGPHLKFHTANVKTSEESAGKVMIVRYVDKPSLPSGDARDVVAQIMIDYDEMMKELSKTSTLHPYVITIYGRTSGDPLDRTTALNLDPVLISGVTFVQERNETNTITGIDAAAHLNRHGIDWVPQNKQFRVNMHGEPIMGLDMDLRKRVAERAVDVYQTQMDIIFILYEKFPTWKIHEQIREEMKEVRSLLAREPSLVARSNPAALPSVRSLSQMVATLTRARKVLIAIPKSHFLTYLDIPNLRLNGADDYLSKVNTVLGKPAPFQWPSIWARIMTLLAKGTSCVEFRADYCPSDDGDKFVVILLVAGRDTDVWLEMYYIDIPDSRRNEARVAFGIASHAMGAGSPSISLF